MPVAILSPELSKAASMHAEDICSAGEAVHIGGDGCTPTERISKQIKWKTMIAELIEVGSTIATEIIESLVIDDGNEERSNRKVIFGKNSKIVGIACRAHPIYGMITVLDFIGGSPEAEMAPGTTPEQPSEKEIKD